MTASGLPADWVPHLFIVGAMTFFLVVLLHMLANALNLPTLKSWAKGEYLQVAVTFVLAGAMLGGAGVIWLVMQQSVITIYSTTHPGQIATDDAFIFTQSYISQSLLECEKFIYQKLMWVNAWFRFVGKISTEPIGVDPLGGWHTSAYTGLLGYILGHLNNLFLLNYMQYRFLSLIKYVAPLMIQIGLVLRAFPLSRGAGGLLLAAGFGFFVVYPLSLAMLVTLQPMPAHGLCITSFTVPPSMDPSVNPLCVTNEAQLAEVRAELLAHENDLASLLEQAKIFLTTFYIQAVFLPMVALIITFTFIRQTGSVLGADLSEIGRGLIKLI